MNKCEIRGNTAVLIIQWKGQTLEAFVDAADWPQISQYRWCIRQKPDGRFYVCESRNYGCQLHRFLLNPKPKESVDHVDRNGLNNRRANIRLCTISDNGGNRIRNRNKRHSQYKGVQPSNPGRWRARIDKHNIVYNLGSFGTEADAARAYDEAAKRLFGAFARLNFPASAA